MGNWVNLYTFIAFVLGVLLSATVKGFTGRARSKVGV
jgi:hypothetical protein